MRRIKIAIDEYGIGFAKIGIIVIIPREYKFAYHAGDLYEYYADQFSMVEDRRMPEDKRMPYNYKKVYARTKGNKLILETENTLKF